jgi:tRNA(fMet)-specific endonuclease VapC
LAQTDQDSREAPGILDTCVVISLPDITDPAVLPEDPRITAITLAELAAGPASAKDEKLRAARAMQVRQAEKDFDPLPFNSEAARAYGRVAAALRDRRATKKARSYDALIAATALANGMPVYTCNPDDFAGIDGLEVVAVPEPTRLVG